MFRLTRSQLAAFLAVSCSSTTVWGQMPANNLSPINQINRAWGFWVSDGYHECSKPAKQRHAINKSQSALDKFDPIGGSLYHQNCLVVPQTPVLEQPAVTSTPMTISPPQPYSQFATPAETPLPGSYHSSQTPPPLPTPIQSYPAGPQPSSPNFPSDDKGYVPSSPLPDPNSFEPVDTTPSSDSVPGSTPNSTSPAPKEISENNSLETNEVPPSPSLRRRKPSDKPLGEIPDSWTPSEKNQSQPQAVPDSDEDLNLLTPSNASPPFTYDNNRPNGILAGWRNNENYPPHYQPASQQSKPPAYPIQLPIDQMHRQASQQTMPLAYPKQSPIDQPHREVSQTVMPPGSRSLMQREQASTNMLAPEQAFRDPAYTTVQNPHAQPNVNRYR